jgi:hypothetical protein
MILMFFAGRKRIAALISQLARLSITGHKITHSVGKSANTI